MIQPHNVWLLGLVSFTEHMGRWSVWQLPSIIWMWQIRVSTYQLVDIWIFFKQRLLWALQAPSVCVDTCPFLFGRCLWVALLGPIVNVHLSFKNMQTVLSPFSIPTNSVWESVPHMAGYQCFMVCFGKTSVQMCCSSVNHVACLSLCWKFPLFLFVYVLPKRAHLYFCLEGLYRIDDLQISFPVCDLSFHFLNGVVMYKSFKFCWKSNLSTFHVHIVPLMSYLRALC